MALPNPDPVNIPWHRLFLFWEAYNNEYINLLKKWHNDTAQLRRPPGELGSVPTGNLLYDSFLDTWGKGQTSKTTTWSWVRRVTLRRLATASVKPRAACLDVLQQILEIAKDGDGNPMLIDGVPMFIDPPQLKVSEQEANDKANEALQKLRIRFTTEFNTLQNKVDTNMRELIGGSDDTYLQALLRMMDIETECFKVQKNFLETGTVPAPEMVA